MCGIEAGSEQAQPCPHPHHAEEQLKHRCSVLGLEAQPRRGARAQPQCQARTRAASGGPGRRGVPEGAGRLEALGEEAMGAPATLTGAVQVGGGGWCCMHNVP